MALKFILSTVIVVIVVNVGAFLFHFSAEWMEPAFIIGAVFWKEMSDQHAIKY